MKDAYKAAFFVMLVRRYLTSGVFCRNKKELLTGLEGSEKDIIAAGLDLPLWLAAHTERQCYATLLRWCKDVLQGCSL